MNASEHDIRYVGFWARVAASLVDSILVLVVILPPLIAIYGWEYFDAQSLIQGPADFVLSWIVPAIAVIAFWIKKQATPGKLLYSARIVDQHSFRPASTGQLIGRYFGYFVSGLPLGLGLLWVAFDARKQGWHDKLAGTVVIYHADGRVRTDETKSTPLEAQR